MNRKKWYILTDFIGEDLPQIVFEYLYADYDEDIKYIYGADSSFRCNCCSSQYSTVSTSDHDEIEELELVDTNTSPN